MFNYLREFWKHDRSFDSKFRHRPIRLEHMDSILMEWNKKLLNNF